MKRVLLENIHSAINILYARKEDADLDFDVSQYSIVDIMFTKYYDNRFGFRSSSEPSEVLAKIYKDFYGWTADSSVIYSLLQIIDELKTYLNERGFYI